eukprot:3273812-Prymnesium_polylepis.1
MASATSRNFGALGSDTLGHMDSGRRAGSNTGNMSLSLAPTSGPLALVRLRNWRDERDQSCARRMPTTRRVREIGRGRLYRRRCRKWGLIIAHKQGHATLPPPRVELRDECGSSPLTRFWRRKAETLTATYTNLRGPRRAGRAVPRRKYFRPYRTYTDRTRHAERSKPHSTVRAAAPHREHFWSAPRPRLGFGINKHVLKLPVSAPHGA